ncbi:MAG: 30S ribosomal protein S9 [Nanoarchaeota archaeon]|nr:30S ribosomal protein S9 [Nanoarchaeota archaeon]
MGASIIHKSGYRKTSVARATVKKGKGLVLVNNQPYKEYQPNVDLQLKLLEPLLISGMEAKVDVTLNVFGGGQNSQVDAMRQAIAKALVELSGSEELKRKFVEYDRSLLVADTRFKEMKKPNNSHARAKRQKSYR